MDYREFLQAEGFQLIGQLSYRLRVSLWWHPSPDRLLQVLVIELGDSVLVKGDKSYHLQSVTADGETWTRDISLLHTYLETHFPEVRISFSHFRDLPRELADAEVRRRLMLEAPTVPLPTVEEIAQLQAKLNASQRDARSMEELVSLSGSPPDALTGYLRNKSRTQRREIQDVADRVQRQHERLGLLQHLQREYQRKGSAAVYTISVSSNLQVADEVARFRDALRHVVKELADQHRYQVTQKLQGGRLNIQLSEATQPAITWIEQWMGGALSPIQVGRIGRQVAELGNDHFTVTPDEPIMIDGRVRHAEKHLAARFMSTVLNRLDRTEDLDIGHQFDPESISPDLMPLRLGLRVDEINRPMGPALLPLAQMLHTCASGSTGAGKSFFTRVVVEEASQFNELNILILDPRAQFTGLLLPEDRPKVLDQYKMFGMQINQARGYTFDYFAPAQHFAPALPNELTALAVGHRIVSFKGMPDRLRCTLAAQILDAVFNFTSVAESEHPKLLVVIDEAQLFTRKRVDESARDAAAKSERALELLAREGRKYGIQLLLATQSFMTFSHDLVSIRQLTATKAFFRNSDRELQYADDVIGDGKALVNLPTGTMMIHNAAWGSQRINVRPPFSRVLELSEQQLRQLVGRPVRKVHTLTADARKLFAAVEANGSPPNPLLNLSRAGPLAGISSQRKLQEVVNELERAGIVTTRTLPERGSPRVIELLGQNPSPRIQSE